MTDPIISVIIPVYNVEKWLTRCVRSIIGQSYSNLEIILVDDGSTDQSGEICDSMQREDKRISVIHKPNGGLSDARNAGLKTSTGEYISFIDSDDWVEPHFFEILLQVLRDNKTEISGCSYRKCIEDHNYEKENIEYSVSSYAGLDVMSALIDNSIQQVVWNKLYKKTLLNGLSFEKGKYHEDEFWSYQVFARVDKYVESTYIGYDYFQRADSIMGETYSLKRLDAVEAKVKRQQYLDDNLPALASKGQINLIFTCLYHGQLAIKLEPKTRKKAFDYLTRVVKSRNTKLKDLQGLRFTHKLWILMAKISLKFTCRLRNHLKIGC